MTYVFIYLNSTYFIKISICKQITFFIYNFEQKINTLYYLYPFYMLQTTLLFVKHLNVSIFVQGLEKRIFFRLSHNQRHKHMHFKSIVAKKRLRHSSYHNISRNSRSLLSNWDFLTDFLNIFELTEKRCFYKNIL